MERIPGLVSASAWYLAKENAIRAVAVLGRLPATADINAALAQGLLFTTSNAPTCRSRWHKFWLYRRRSRCYY